MRRLVMGTLAVLGLLCALLAPTGPAAADPTSIIVWSSGSTWVGGEAVTITVSLDESTDKPVTWGWDLLDDGQLAYDDVPNPSQQMVTWDPAKWGAGTPGTYVVHVRALVQGQADPLNAQIPIQVAATNETPTVFQAQLPALGTVAAGQSVTVRPTVTNAPSNALSFAWDTDNDGVYDDGFQGWVTYTPTDVGAHALKVRVVDAAQPDSPVVASTWLNVVPSMGAASLAGTGRVGQALSVIGAVAIPSDTTKVYTWLRDGTVISGATSSTYRLTTADAGRRISVSVAGHKSIFNASPVTSVSRPVAAYVITRPSYTGTTRVGRRLTGAPGTWAAYGHTRSFTWLRDGRPIKGATARTYVTRAADRGHRISFRVTMRRNGFPTVSATSAARTITR